MRFNAMMVKFYKREISVVDRDFDDSAVIDSLMSEANSYSERQDFGGCMKRMLWFRDNFQSPDIKLIASTTRARCAMDISDYPEALATLNAVDQATISEEGLLYLNKLYIEIFEHTGDFANASRLLEKSLNSPELKDSFNRDLYADLLGLSVRIFASLGEFDRSVAYFEQGRDVFSPGPSFDSFALNYAYSLRMLGRSAESEKVLLNIIDSGSGDLNVDVYYDLGFIYLQFGRIPEASAMFKNAMKALPSGTITAEQIEVALQKSLSLLGK